MPRIRPWKAVDARIAQAADPAAPATVAEEISCSTTISSTNQRRKLLLQTIATATSTALVTYSPQFAFALQATDKYLIPTPPYSKELSWPLGKIAFSLLPLAGTFTRRATIETCIVPNTIWTHDQLQGIVNVNVPIRQTVVRLQSGGLWILNPVAPTLQLRNMMDRLVKLHGPVKHIVLGTVALEHKATFGDFSAHYPDATLWIQPGQWSFPINLPIEYYVKQRGKRLRDIPVLGSKQNAKYVTKEVSPQIPAWANDFDYEVLGPFSFQSVGGFSETAFYHKSTKTLLVTDTVVSVTKTPPAIIQEDPRALLFHARDAARDTVRDTAATREKGWRRMVQFGLVFFPSQIDVASAAEALVDASKVPNELRNLGDGAIPISSLYPWSWHDNDADIRNFEAISQNGKLFCPPILTKLILDREPQATLEWVDRVCTRFKDMQRIIPGHLNNDVRVSGSREFYQAFDPLRSQPNRPVPQRALAEDLALLQSASDVLTKYGIVAPSQVCDGEPARRRGRFAG
ncbi:hypothetical protein MPSEU_000967400 [Mayamaea pseudoterrestris]|nr:hypothetical protein MPSEU_000967400 [Mayamaea pseudoterrestris]